jgi:hypothetical protein
VPISAELNILSKRARAVGQLARQGGHVERALAPGQVARLASGLARHRGFHHLGDDLLGLRRVLLEILLQLVVDHTLDHRADLGGNQLVLGLAGKFRIRHLDRQDAGKALAGIVSGQLHLLLLAQSGAGRIGIDLPGQGRAERSQMGAAVALRDVVGEAQHVLVVAVGPLQGQLHGEPV